MKKFTLFSLLIYLSAGAQINFPRNLHMHSSKYNKEQNIQTGIQARPATILQALDSINVIISFTNQMATQYFFDYDSLGNITINRTLTFDQGQPVDGELFTMQYNGRLLTFKEHANFDNTWNPDWRKWYYYTGSQRDSAYKEIINGGQWQPDRKYYYSYNSQGNTTRILHKTYNNGHWEPAQKDTVIYNQAGLITEIITQTYSNGIWLNTHREIRQYDSQNRISEIVYYDWDGYSAWEYEEREIYTYSGNNLTEIIAQEYDNGQWENTYKESYRYNSNDDLVTLINYQYTNGNWEAQAKLTFDYDTSVTRDELLMPELDGMDNHMYQHKITLGDVYQLSNGFWVHVADINFYYSNRNIVYVNRQLLRQITLYPNPVKDKLIIRSSGNLKINRIKLYNLSGQLIETFDVNRPYLEMKHLKPGLYQLNIETTEGTAGFKLIKK